MFRIHDGMNSWFFSFFSVTGSLISEISDVKNIVRTSERVRLNTHDLLSAHATELIGRSSEATASRFCIFCPFLNLQGFERQGEMITLNSGLYCASLCSKCMYTLKVGPQSNDHFDLSNFVQPMC
jgi:hypothetical protein